MLDTDIECWAEWSDADWPELRSRGSGEVSDEQWKAIRSKLGRGSYPTLEATRQKVEGLAFLCRSECQWRDVPADFGRWNSIYIRCRRWARVGILDEVLEAFVRHGVTECWPIPGDVRPRVFDDRCEPVVDHLKNAIFRRLRTLRFSAANSRVGSRPIQRLYVDYEL